MFLRELYNYRHLLREIVVKNIKIQYRRSVLGVFWTFLQPLLTTLVLVAIFGKLFGGNARDTVNYPIFVLTGRLLYEFFSQSTKRAMRSVTLAASVIRKVRLPKYIYPLANVISVFVTFLISLIVLVCFLVFFLFWGDAPPVLGWHVLLTPVPLAILFLLCTGVGFILATLTVFFKDVEYLYDVFCLILFYATPIMYSPARLGAGKWTQLALQANPLYSIVEMFRDCVLRGRLLNPHHLLYALGFSLVTLALGGLLFWRKQEKFILHL
ncbi:MAG: ABC transporter permease [Oscillospiraceae bacterium]|jgi:ABC-2 type transport system permease protein|nr:ABC transporter permease [Oscillospiraceae bacterium]